MIITNFDKDKHEYNIDGDRVFSVTEILSCLCDYSPVSPEVLRKARERGINIHASIAEYLINKNVTPFLPYGFEDFWELVYCKYFENRNVIVDFKTRTSKPYYDTLQLHGYVLLATEYISENTVNIEKALYSKSIMLAGTPDYVSRCTDDAYDLFTITITKDGIRLYRHALERQITSMFVDMLLARQKVSLWRKSLKPNRAIEKLNNGEINDVVEVEVEI